MKIFNNTCYTTASLRRFFVACLDAEEKVRLAKFPMRSALLISVEPVKDEAQGCHISDTGKAFVYLVPPIIGRGKDKQVVAPDKVTSLETIAMVFLHQIGHLRGEHDCNKINRIAHERIAAAVAKRMKLDLQKLAVRPKKDAQVERYKAIVEMVEEKRRVYEHARDMYLKWEARRRTLELAMIRNGKMDPEDMLPTRKR